MLKNILKPIIILAIIFLVVATLLLVQQKRMTTENTGTVFPKPTPYSLSTVTTDIPTLVTQTPSIATFTGAILVPLPPEDVKAYDQLYKLLAQKTIAQPTFTVEPLPKQWLVRITVEKPIADHLSEVQAWLDANGYSNLPQKNVMFIEQ